MNWHVSHRVLRKKPLSDEERDALLALVRRWRDGGVHDFDLELAPGQRADGLLAVGQTEMYYSGPDEGDVRKLLDALTELRNAVAGSHVEVWDDLDLVGFSVDQGRYETMGQCDVEAFELPSPRADFVRLSALDWDHRFTPLKRTAARPLRVSADSVLPTLVRVVDGPAFHLRSGPSVNEARMSVSLSPSNHACRVTELQVGFLDAASGLIDHEEYGLDLRLDRVAREVVSLSAPELLDLCDHVDVAVLVEVDVQVDVGVWSITREGASLRFAALSAPVGTTWPLTLTLGGFADPLGKLERWRLVGELALERNPQDATGLIRFAVLADDDSVLGHHEVYVRPTEQPRFGSWWHPGLDELKTATRLRVSVDLTLTTRDILGRYQV